MSQSDTIIYSASEWNANDYSNLITISAAAISSEAVSLCSEEMDECNHL